MTFSERFAGIRARPRAMQAVLLGWLLPFSAYAASSHGASAQAAQERPPAPVITSIAGGGGVGDGGPALEARLSLPGGVLVEPEGSLIVVDFGNHRIRRVEAETGIITTIAGTGEPGFSGDGGPASEAQIARPEYAAFSPDGDLYIVDSHNHRIRRIDRKTGIIDTVAGSGERGFGGDGGPALDARLNQPEGIAFDAEGNYFIGDTLNSRVRRVDAETQVITTVAGHGEVGLSEDGVPGPEMKFMRVARLAVGPHGDLYIADSPSHRIQVLDAETGRVHTVAGTGVSGYSGDGGPALEARLSYPEGPIVDPRGNIYFADLGNHAVRRVDAETGTITTVAGNGTRGFSGDGGPATEAQLWSPGRLALDARDNLYVADIANARIRRVHAETGDIDTVVGSGSLGDGGPGRAGQLAIPGDLAFHDGTLYIAEFGNRRVRSYRPDADVLATVAGGGTEREGVTRASRLELKLPEGIAVDPAGRIYIADAMANTIWRVDPETDRLERFAGNGEVGFSGDGGPASEARLNRPGGVTVTPDGTVWIADYGNRCLRAVSPETAVIRTVSTDPPELGLQPIVSLTDHRGVLYWVVSADEALYRLDPGTGEAARIPLRLPCCRGDTGELQIGDLTFTPEGRLFLADTLAHRIVEVDPETGEGRVVAGAHDRPGFAGDGRPAAEASLFRPGAVVAGGSGELFVADSFNHRVRRIHPLEPAGPPALEGDAAVETPFGTVSSSRLPNGLTTVVVERPDVHLAAVNLTAGVGARHDPPELSGMAHMLEHVSLTGTSRIGSLDPDAEAAALERSDRIIQRIDEATREGIGPGRLEELRERLNRSLAEARALAEPGEPYGRRLEARGAVGLNATTRPDVTQFFCRLPTAEIGRWLRDEADRLRNPLFRSFYRERSVVVQEIQPPDPMAPALDALWHQVRPEAPEGAGLATSIQDVLSIDRPGALDYFRRTYVPERITVTVVGDVEAERVFALVEEAFGGWRPRSSRTPAAAEPGAPVEASREPGGPAPEVRSMLVPRGRSHTLLVGFPAPLGTSEDAAALAAWQELLTSEELSPLLAELRARRGLVTSLGFSARFPARAEPAIATLQVDAAPGVGPEELARAVFRSLRQLPERNERDLEGAILLARNRLARRLADPAALAAELGARQSVHGDWRTLPERMRSLAALTPEALRSAARRLLAPPDLESPTPED